LLLEPPVWVTNLVAWEEKSKSFIYLVYNKENKMTQKKPKGTNIIYRRYRRTRNGKILDAYDYGYKGWPITVKRS